MGAHMWKGAKIGRMACARSGFKNSVKQCRIAFRGEVCLSFRKSDPSAFRYLKFKENVSGNKVLLCQCINEMQKSGGSVQ